jgi:hypothetical protein
MQSNTPILHRVVRQTPRRVTKLTQIDWPAFCNSHHAPPVVAERESARLKVVQPKSPPPLAGNGMALVDSAIVQQLTRDVGMQRLPEVLGAFVAELGRRIPLVRKAIAERDLQVLGREEHQVREIGTRHGEKLYETLLTQGLETCAILSDLNVTNDPRLEEARKMLEDALVNLDIKSLRESPELQSSVKTKMQAICDKFDF